MYRYLYTKRRAERAGKIDGQKGWPDGPGLQGYLAELKQCAEEEMDRLVQAWKAADAKLSARMHATMVSCRSARERLDELKNVYPDHATGGGRPRGHILLLVLLALAETPLTTIVFRVFQESEYLTYLLAVGTAAALVILAHFVGSKLKASGTATRVHAKQAGRLAFAFALVSVGILGGLTGLRVYYLRELGERVAPVVEVALFAVQLAIWLAAVLISYNASDELRDQQARAEAAEKAFRASVECRKRDHHRFRARAYEKKDAAEGLAAAYQRANLHARKSRDNIPGYLLGDLEATLDIRIPQPLEDDPSLPDDVSKFLATLGKGET